MPLAAIDAFLEGVCASACECVCVAAGLLALMEFEDTRLFAAGIKRKIELRLKKKRDFARNHHKRRRDLCRV